MHFRTGFYATSRSFINSGGVPCERPFLDVRAKIRVHAELEKYRGRVSAMTAFAKFRILVAVAAVMTMSFSAPVNSAAAGDEGQSSASVARILQGAIDIHVHADPDSHKRYIDYIDVAKLAKSRGMRGLVIKNHFEPTASMAYIVRKEVPGIEVFGGIALDRQVGGVNPSAVEYMAHVKGGYGKLVWMPTLTSENAVHAFNLNQPFVSVARGGELLPETKEVIGLIAKYGLVLATGHVSADEALAIVKEGERQHVQHMVVTHAMEGPVWMNVAQMQDAVNRGSFIEFDYNLGTMVRLQKPGEHNDRNFFLAEYKQAIRALGPEHCILSEWLTFDSPDLDAHVDGVADFVKALGLNDHEIDLMLKENPARLLGLPVQWP